MKSKIIISFCLLLGLSSIEAQEKGHYIYFNGGAGLHELKYELANGSTKNNIGYTFELGYDYFFSKHWGLGSGIGVQSFQSSSTINFMEEHSAIDTDGDSYQYRNYYNNWEEQQKVLLLDIPVGIKFQTKLSPKWKLLSSVGGKISLPISAKYETADGSIETKGFYPQYNVELYGMPQHGFDTYTSFPSDDISIKPTYSAFIDLGGLYALNKKLDLYLGVYANYGLNNMIDAKEASVLAEDKTYNGTFASNQTDKILPLAFGLKVGIRFHAKEKERYMRAEPQKIISRSTPQPKAKKAEAPITRKKYVIPEFKDPMEEAYIEAKKIAAVTDIKFELGNEKVVGNPQEDKLKRLAKQLLENPAMRLRIIGHTCDIDTHDKNVRIGLDRAFAIRNKLLDYGVPNYQLLVESKAYDEPLAPNTNDENRAINRRVQLIIIR